MVPKARWNGSSRLASQRSRKGEIPVATKEFAFDQYHELFSGTLRTLVQAAQDQGIVLRGLGAAAVITHCPGHVSLLSALKRNLTDLDVMALGSQTSKIEPFFASLGYEVLGGRGVTVGMWDARRIFVDVEGRRPSVDVFFDKLDFCHTIDFRHRLAIDFPTISLADLILEKLQIVEINEKDLKDLIVILLEHGLAEEDEPERVNASYIARLLAQNWGFYYTAATNLGKVLLTVERYAELGEAQRLEVVARVKDLRDRVEREPKTLRWRLRARVGTRIRWYQDVGEGYREVATEAKNGGSEE